MIDMNKYCQQSWHYQHWPDATDL